MKLKKNQEKNPLIMRSRSGKAVSSEHREIRGIPFILERKRISRIHLYVMPPDGSVLVTAPVLCPLSDIETFVAGRESWINKHRRKYMERPAQARACLEYRTGDILYFWGRPYRLDVTEEEGRSRGKAKVIPQPEFGLNDNDLELLTVLGAEEADLIAGGKNGTEDKEISGCVELVIPEGTSKEYREKLVQDLYRKVLEPEAERILAFWSDKTGLRFSSWHSRFMKSRWGSLSVQKKRVCLNIRLAEKPEICLVYVALHEVTHVKEANHGPAFKAILSRYMPSWRYAEKLLKK